MTWGVASLRRTALPGSWIAQISTRSSVLPTSSKKRFQLALIYHGLHYQSAPLEQLILTVLRASGKDEKGNRKWLLERLLLDAIFTSLAPKFGQHVYLTPDSFFLEHRCLTIFWQWQWQELSLRRLSIEQRQAANVTLHNSRKLRAGAGTWLN